jgi:hypothetical protein
MYVEAICPLCFHSHVVPDDLRGERFRCEECEELFIVNRRAKRTSKRPSRPPTVRPADDLDEVRPVDEVETLPVVRGARGRRSRRIEDDDHPRTRPPRRRGVWVGVVIGLGAAFVLLVGLGAAGAWLYFRSHSPRPQADNLAAPSAPIPIAPAQLPGDADQAKKAEPKAPRELPKNEPDKPGVGPAWKVKADPPAMPARLPADYKKEIAVRAVNGGDAVFPTSAASPFVAVGDNFDDKDERQVWNLQTGAQDGKVVGRRFSAGPPVLSPDGAHLAFIPFGEKDIVDVVPTASGKPVRVDAGLAVEVLDFAGPGKLLVAGKQGGALSLRVWDASTGRREHDFDGPPLGTPPTLTRDMLAVSPGGAYLAVVTPESLWIWDLKTGTTAGRRELPWNATNWLLPCRGVSYSPDGSELAALFQVKSQSRLVCWDVGRGEAVADVTFAELRPAAETELAYRGHVLGWVGDRRGWLLYGHMFLDRKADKVAPVPAGLAALGLPFRRMVGPDHVATLPAGPGNNKVLTVRRFDPDRPGGP